MSDFETAWKEIYPHHATRSKKAPAEAIWVALTTDGYNCVGRVDSSPIKLGCVTETEDALCEAIKAMRMCTPEEDLRYVPGMQVWLHQARFLDYDEDERKHLAGQYDDLQQTKERLAKSGKLEVVR